MRLHSLTIAAALLAASLPAAATPQLRNATDIWYNNQESGWGVNLIHQGSTIFASLFVYDAAGQPRWYTASDLHGSDGPNSNSTKYTGALYESTGPAFSGSFDPGTVTRRMVGTFWIDVHDTFADIEYQIDHVNVLKRVIRQSFRQSSLSSDAYAFQFQPALPDGTPQVSRNVHMVLADNVFTLTGSSGSDFEPPCQYSGNRSVAGQYQTVSGTYSCADGARTGPWSMKVEQTPNGYLGAFQGNGVGGTQWARIGAARRGAPNYDDGGFRNGMWFPPGESGWGVNIIEQGDTIFSSLFVYDAQRKPHCTRPRA